MTNLTQNRPKYALILKISLPITIPNDVATATCQRGIDGGRVKGIRAHVTKNLMARAFLYFTYPIDISGDNLRLLNSQNYYTCLKCEKLDLCYKCYSKLFDDNDGNLFLEKVIFSVHV